MVVEIEEQFIEAVRELLEELKLPLKEQDQTIITKLHTELVARLAQRGL